jgi:putative molybdopterin biosynthesis protein
MDMIQTDLLTAEDVARQLKIKKYTVYELIKRGELPSSRVGKQVRVSQADINEYLRASKEQNLSAVGKFQASPVAWPVGIYPFSDTNGHPDSAPQTVPQGAPEAGDPMETYTFASAIICGQDICLDFLADRISATRKAGVLRSYMGSYNGLCALYLGKVSMTAAHLWDGETDTYNYPYIRALLPGVPAGALRLAGRRQGLYVKKGNPLNIRDWRDLARPDVTIVNREKGCGTRVLLDQKLTRLGIRASDIQGYRRESTSHLACASTVAKGGADAGCGCEQGVRNIPGVEFIPLQLEWYDLVFRLSDRDTPAIREISSYVVSPEFALSLEIMGGYDLSQTGRYTEL